MPIKRAKSKLKKIGVVTIGEGSDSFEIDFGNLSFNRSPRYKQSVEIAGQRLSRKIDQQIYAIPKKKFSYYDNREIRWATIVKYIDNKLLGQATHFRNKWRKDFLTMCVYSHEGNNYFKKR